MHADVTRARFYTNASLDILANLSVEDQQHGDEHLCGQIFKGMYGTRGVAQYWQRKCSKTARELGFTTRKVPLCHFYHSVRQVCRFVHNGDLVLVGKHTLLKAVSEYMAIEFKVEVARVGPDKPALPRVLFHSMRCARRGIEYERDHRHVDRLI